MRNCLAQVIDSKRDGVLWKIFEPCVLIAVLQDSFYTSRKLQCFKHYLLAHVSVGVTGSKATTTANEAFFPRLTIENAYFSKALLKDDSENGHK